MFPDGMKTNPHLPHLTIFDWDDTLFPTNSLIRQSSLQSALLRLHESPAFAEQMRRIEDSVLLCLETALTHGYVVIITNSEHGWVQRSSSLFFPKLVPLLQGVQILSARNLFGYKTQNPSLWKKMAFYSYLRNLAYDKRCRALQSVVSIGDSWDDRESLNCAGGALSNLNAFGKTVKLVDTPSLGGMEIELNLLSSELIEIYNLRSSADLMFYCREGNPCFLEISNYTCQQI